MLGWEFLTPEDDALSDEQLLRETLDFVTGDDGFRRARHDFFDWQQKFLKSADEGLPAPTAFVHQVNRHFGWK